VPVGFALTEELGRVEWLCELSVHPDHGRRGIGGALVEAVARAARLRGCDRIGLSTFRAVPFNAPFYDRHGFTEVPLDRAGPPLAIRFHAEVPAGVNPGERVLMVRFL
jgi:GNAT superfamily N-acetyltransferase